MSTAELKQQILREVESFDAVRMKEFFGVLQNYLQSQQKYEYIGLSENEIISIEKAIKQLDNNEGIPHEEVMKKIRKKYSNA